MQSLEKNGKTLHLLKANSKPSKSGKKRKNVPIMGTFEQFTESKKKADSQGKKNQVQEILEQNKDQVLVLQRGPNGQPIMGPKPQNKDVNMKTK